MTTPILNIVEISGSQINQYATANEMVRSLEAAANDFLSISLASGNVSLTPEQFSVAYFFVGAGHSVARNLTVPQAKRSFAVSNNGSANLTVVRGSSSVVIAAGDCVALFTDGSANGLVRVGSAAGGGVAGFSSGKNISAPNATIPVVYLQPDASETSVDIALVPKGLGGAFMLAVPDGTFAGGNKRGAAAIDLQLVRTNANQVASGAGAIAIGGENRSSGPNSITIGLALTASGYYDLAMGNACVASGNYSAAFPYQSTASAQYALAIGTYCTASSEGSVVMGRFGSSGSVNGQWIFANGRFATDGDSQESRMILRRQTTDENPAVLTYNAGSVGADTQKTLRDNSVVEFKGRVKARQNTTGDTAVWTFAGVIKRGTGAGSTALMAAVTPTVVANDPSASSWGLAVTADTTNGCLKVEATGEASKNIKWDCLLECFDLVG